MDEETKKLIEESRKLLELFKASRPPKKEEPKQALLPVEFFYERKRVMKLPDCEAEINAINWVNRNGIKWTHANFY